MDHPWQSTIYRSCTLEEGCWVPWHSRHSYSLPPRTNTLQEPWVSRGLQRIFQGTKSDRLWKKVSGGMGLLMWLINLHMKIGVPICQLIMSDLIGSSPTAAVRAAKMNKPSWVLWWRTPRCSAAIRQESVCYGESPCLIGKSANIHGPCSIANYGNLLEGNPKKCLVYGRLW